MMCARIDQGYDGSAAGFTESRFVIIEIKISPRYSKSDPARLEAWGYDTSEDSHQWTWGGLNPIENLLHGPVHNKRILAWTLGTDVSAKWIVVGPLGETNISNDREAGTIAAINKYIELLAKQLEGHVPPDNEIYDDDVIEYLEKKNEQEQDPE